MKKEYLYLSITESLYCTAETQLYFLKFLKKKEKQCLTVTIRTPQGHQTRQGWGPE